jgi:iron(III) transport system permease protein
VTELALPAQRRWSVAGLYGPVRASWYAWLFTAVLAALVLYPLAMLFLASFRGGEEGQAAAITLANYQRIFGSLATYELIWTTIWLATVRVALACCVGVVLAWLVARTDMPWRQGIEVLVWIKFFSPPLPMVVAWILLAGKTGVLNSLLANLPFVQGPVFDVYSYWGIVFVSALQLSAFIFLLTVPAFRSMDASLEDAGKVAGAGSLRVLRRITAPLALPAILGASLYAFIFALESFETEVMLGTPARIYVLSTQIYVLAQQYPNDLSGATALSAFFLVAVAGVIALQSRLLGGRSFTTVSGHGYAVRPVALGKWRWPACAICLLYFAVSTLLPLAMLILGTFMRGWGIWSASNLTLNHWQVSLRDPRLMAALTNTVVLGLLVGLGGTAVCAAAAYLWVRTRFAGRRVLEFITWSPRIAPGPVLAIGFAWAYIGLPIFRPILGTLLMLAVVLVVNSLPLGSRILAGGMHQVAYELEEAAQISGASWLTTFRRVLLPLLAPVLVTSFVLLFLVAIRNLVLIIFFYTPESRVLSAILWEGWRGGNPERALVAGLIMMAISLVALGAALLLRRRSGIASFY